MKNLILVMPMFNEADGITETLVDLHMNLVEIKKLIIIDDFSTDNSKEVALHYGRSNDFPVEVYKNEKNVGHGQSTVRGLLKALESANQSDFVLTLDGDGQVPGRELRKLIEAQELLNADVVIGLRTQRTDLLYRRIITRLAIASLFLITGVKSRDSNTPVRLWKTQTLSDALNRMPEANLSVPNSHLTRVIGVGTYQSAFSEILQQDRNGKETMGVTWSNKWSHLPSKKLLRFSQKALIELWVYR
jgi:glycosyltransferase involved in cell wall biosynthesis